MPSFLSQSGSFFLSDATPSIAVNQPTTGQTYTIQAGQDNVYFTNSGTIAALTVVLPAGPKNGDAVTLKFRGAVTALTIQPFALSAPSAATAGQVQEYRFINGWVYW